jgi:hypothetical protein
MRTKPSIWVGLGAALAAALTAAPLHSQQEDPPPPAISPDDPADVEDTTQVPGVPIRLFDEFSWRMFLTMIWPADPAMRGAPDRNRGLDSPGPRVFETFRANWETFQPNGAEPPLFDADAPVTPCSGVTLPSAPLIIAAFSKFEELRQAGFGRLVGPLPSQNRRYTRYLTGYNRIQYDHIRANRLYLGSQLGNVRFPDTSTVVKSAWIEMEGIANPERYYTRRAWILDPATGQCSEQLLGLVGLHIVRKTASRPQWIWSTFEHVDTVPDSGAPRPLVYHSGDGTPMPGVNPYSEPTAQVPPPFNVRRLTPIHEATEEANRRYRSELARRGSVWQNYRLVMTQWPLSIRDPSRSGRPNNTFPGTGSDSTAFANTTMETFEQVQVADGCMGCHDLARRRTDFVWSIETHAFTPGRQFLSARGTRGTSPLLRQLRMRMEGAVEANRRSLRNRRN